MFILDDSSRYVIIKLACLVNEILAYMHKNVAVLGTDFNACNRTCMCMELITYINYIYRARPD